MWLAAKDINRNDMFACYIAAKELAAEKAKESSSQLSKATSKNVIKAKKSDAPEMNLVSGLATLSFSVYLVRQS